MPPVDAEELQLSDSHHASKSKSAQPQSTAPATTTDPTPSTSTSSIENQSAETEGPVNSESVSNLLQCYTDFSHVRTKTRVQISISTSFVQIVMFQVIFMYNRIVFNIL